MLYCGSNIKDKIKNMKILIISILFTFALNASTFVSDTSECGELRRIYISAPIFPDKQEKYLSRASFMRVILKESNKLKIPFGELVCNESDTLSGFIKIRFEIDKNGAVTKSQCIETDFKNKEFISKVEKYTSSYRFNLNKVPRDELIVVEYKFVFNQMPKKKK